MNALTLTRHRACLLVAASLLVVASSLLGARPARAQLSSGLISQGEAASVGLKRAWFARAAVNPARSKVVDWILSGDQILILTDAGILQALDANTGKSLWVTQFGNPDYPSLGPDANDKYASVVNGSTVYLFDRQSGRIQNKRPIGGAPGAAPAVGKDYVFVPTITGLIEGYPLDPDAPEHSRWYYQSFGRAMVPPLVTPHSIIWSTERGFLYVASVNNLGVRYRLETNGKFDARAAYQEPLIYAVTRAGELFAIDEEHGLLVWRYMTGFPTDRAPAAVGEKLFITSDEPMLHCVDAKTGLPEWQVPGISQFAAVTKAHVYGVDSFGTVHIMNIADGSPVGRIPNDGTLTALVNDQSDRLYLITETGLVQCLHEIGADKPLDYRAQSAAKQETGDETQPAADANPDATEPTQPAPATTEEPAAPAAEADENPFNAGAPEAAPAAEESDFGTGDEDPFE